MKKRTITDPRWLLFKSHMSSHDKTVMTQGLTQMRGPELTKKRRHMILDCHSANASIFVSLRRLTYSLEMKTYSAVLHTIMNLLLPLLLVLQQVESESLGGDITVDTTLTLNKSAYVVSQDLVVAENATLTIQPGVQLQFDVGVALKVKGAIQAKGNSFERIVFTKTPTNISVDDLNVTAPYNDGIRLSDGNNYRVGRLEIFLRGQWGTVCDDSFDMNDAQVSCIAAVLNF
ncbi:hypothetical protein ACROYT_G033963 [Oculina patagonica]